MGTFHILGGSECAERARREVHLRFLAKLDLRGSVDASACTQGDVVEALADAVDEADKAFLADGDLDRPHGVATVGRTASGWSDSHCTP